MPIGTGEYCCLAAVLYHSPASSTHIPQEICHTRRQYPYMTQSVQLATAEHACTITAHPNQAAQRKPLPRDLDALPWGSARRQQRHTAALLLL
jgi:hypothetical protein